MRLWKIGMVMILIGGAGVGCRTAQISCQQPLPAPIPIQNPPPARVEERLVPIPQPVPPLLPPEEPNKAPSSKQNSGPSAAPPPRVGRIAFDRTT